MEVNLRALNAASPAGLTKLGAGSYVFRVVKEGSVISKGKFAIVR